MTDTVLRRSGGGVFQRLGAEQLKALPPTVMRFGIVIESRRERGGGVEGSNRNGGVKEVSQVWKCEVVDGFKCKEQNLVLDAL